LRVRANELDVHHADPVRHRNDEPIVIAFDIEHHAAILEDAGVAVLRLDIGGLEYVDTGRRKTEYGLTMKEPKNS
jgi:hypothetical protein